MPRIPALDSLLDEPRSRPQKPVVTTVLVNNFGGPWSADRFGGSFNRVRNDADICHVPTDRQKRARKHLHDFRGTFCTNLLLETALNDREIAEIMALGPDSVAAIRRIYVDQFRVAEAL